MFLLCQGASANIIQDPDFTPGSSSWTITPTASGKRAYLLGGGTALFGSFASTEFESISQNLSTITGQTYALKFNLIVISNIENEFNAIVGGKVISSFSHVDGNAYWDNIYQFTASSNSTTLTFSGYNAREVTLLSAVSVDAVSPVPEPETYALMGVGLLAITLKLRKKKQGQSSTALPV